MIRAATMTNMPPQARFDEALYAVSRERQFTSRLIQARLVSYLLKGTPCEGFGVGILVAACRTKNTGARLSSGASADVQSPRRKAWS